MDKKSIIIIILLLIILGGGLIFAYNFIENKAYQQGISDTVLLINQQILSNLQQNGYVPFIYTWQNQTQTIKLIPEQK